MKVLIVGAGIAGPTLAYWLLQTGHEPTLVERAPELRHGGYLVDFWGAGFDVADRMGIAAELKRRGYRMGEAREVGGSGRRIGGFPTDAFYDEIERYVTIARSDLAAVICEALEGRVEMIFGDSVAALDDGGHSVHVAFDSGASRDFDLVVGADGLHSRVRRLAFGPQPRFEKYLGLVFAVFDVDGYRPRDELVAMMHTEVGLQVLRLSLRDDSTMFVVTTRHDGALPPDDVSEQQALLCGRLADAGWEAPAIADLMPRAGSFYFDRVSQIRMPSWTGGRVALIGDAAAAPSFLAGQGSALAMVEAYVLAAELASSAGDHVTAFARYEDRLQPFLRSKQDAAEGLGMAFAPRNRLQLHFRNTVMRLMGLPHVAHLVMGKSLRDAIELPEMHVARATQS